MTFSILSPNEEKQYLSKGKVTGQVFKKNMLTLRWSYVKNIVNSCYNDRISLHIIILCSDFIFSPCIQLE